MFIKGKKILFLNITRAHSTYFWTSILQECEISSFQQIPPPPFHAVFFPVTFHTPNIISQLNNREFWHYICMCPVSTYMLADHGFVMYTECVGKAIWNYWNCRIYLLPEYWSATDGWDIDIYRYLVVCYISLWYRSGRWHDDRCHVEDDVRILLRRAVVPNWQPTGPVYTANHFILNFISLSEWIWWHNPTLQAHQHFNCTFCSCMRIFLQPGDSALISVLPNMKSIVTSHPFSKWDKA